MAEVAFPLATKLIEKLGSIASEQICLAWGVKADLKKLQRTMSTIKDVLLDAEQKQAHNQQIRSWLRQLKDVFLDAEDLLDEFECEALRREVVETFHGTTGKVRRFFSRSNPIAFRFRVGNEIKEITERLDELKSNKAIFDSLTILPHGYGGEDHERPFVPASKVIGRESEKEEIVNLLMQQGDDDQSGNSNNKVSVIPIVGIGGLGKTTLAKWVYDDKRVVGHFELRMWASVPVDFELTKLTRLILGSALNTEISDKLTLDQLQGRLREALKDKTFLLVLDDVWKDDALKWSQLRDLVIEGAKSGSKILVTTRSTAVAEIMGTIPENINLEFLSFEECLSLFVECAFKEGHEKEYPNLFKMGEEIVRKCGGVPLAVKTLGSQLYSKTDQREWKLVRDSEIWKLKQEDSHILPALRLSYTRLPPHLRQCLAYCFNLRKDRIEFRSCDLISYWMAHGILDQSRVHGNMELEDIGELYFKDLWARSFFQNVIDLGIYYQFDMHDLIHDLVQSVAQGECFTVKSANTEDKSENVRHLTVLEAGQNVSTTLQKLNKVRTITAVETKIDESFMCTCFSRFKYLRVVELVTCSLQVLPSSIGSLKHLRYLNLSCNEAITKLPNAICRLQSLQSLHFAGCVNLEELPRDISKMISLTSLCLTTKQTNFTKNGVGCLKSLRSLSIFQCSNLISLPRETSYLASLRNLWISECEQLDLGNINYQGTPLKLQQLFIGRLPRMVALPEWFQGAANALQVLIIANCKNLEALPEWLASFTSLTKLALYSCQKLLSLPEGMCSLASLRELVIYDCPELERRYKRDIGEDWPKISHVPHVSFPLVY
ncbi:PREDICTED: disease resistance [Prunus dulcis]|uniref:PREDICTED: disease resistance n=1 Tax=Prunus dulcis TaxID=3755 RepID=A0A5E4G8V4_PRUDU|nr:putative disease resistance protein RGA4 [Prunus dulcis]VVA36217.1 PREDICTED: disease resistance [Prunus dulcis]